MCWVMKIFTGSPVAEQTTYLFALVRRESFDILLA